MSDTECTERYVQRSQKLTQHVWGQWISVISYKKNKCSVRP